MRSGLLLPVAARMVNSVCATGWSLSMEGTSAFVEDKGELPMLGQTYGVIPGQEEFFLGRVRHQGDLPTEAVGLQLLGQSLHVLAGIT
jgi:hypothetical protein